MHGKNLVHIAEIDRHAAGRRIDVPFERGADAIGNDRNAVFGADPHGLLHLFGALRKNDGVGRLICDPGDGVAVLLAYGLRRHDPVAEGGSQSRNGPLDCAGITLPPGDLTYGHKPVLCCASADVSRGQVAGETRPAAAGLRGQPSVKGIRRRPASLAQDDRPMKGTIIATRCR